MTTVTPEKRFINSIAELLGDNCVKYRGGIIFRGDGRYFAGFKKNVNTIKAGQISCKNGFLIRISINVIRDILPDSVVSQISKMSELSDLDRMEITVTQEELDVISSWITLLIHKSDVEKPRDLLVWQSSDYAWSRDALRFDGRKVK